jgi:DNA helicase-2/ATP-dependent DNA helicase PcrA
VVENELIDHRKLRGTDFGQVFQKFLATLDRYRFLTFGLLISSAVRALEQDSTVYEHVHGPLRHLIVDEYQDINPAQERLIELLAKPPVHLCVVGDDDQAIYQWRGSDVSNIQNFKKRYLAKAASLSVNRRSRPKIIAAANTFAKTIKPRLPKTMKSYRAAGGPEVYCWSADVAAVEAKVIADSIEQCIARGYSYRNISVLFRSVRTSSPPLIKELRDRDIPFRCAGRTGLFLQSDAAVLGKLYAWLCDNPWKNDRWGEPEIVTLDDLVTEFEQAFNDGKSIRGLSGFIEDWRIVVASGSAPANLIRDYYKLLNLLGVQKLNLDDSAASARMGSLARFSQILADFEHVKRRARWVEENGARVFRGGQDRGKWFYRQLFNYLQYYALDAYEDFEGEDTFDLNVVDILTIHQAKGLEWPVVFLPSLVQGRFPSTYAGREQEWLISKKVFPAKSRERYEGGEPEERRLFYVAMTRARDMLYLSSFRRITNRKSPSPFLVEVSGGDPKDAAKLPLPPPYSPPVDGPNEPPPMLSFSQLAHYEDCPMRYRLSDSLGFEPQIAVELGYGKTIHHVLRRIADLARENEKLPSRKQVQDLLDDEFYLPFANAVAFDRLTARAKALIDKYMADYQDDLLRVWETERPFSLHLENGIVNGRADVILDYEDGIASNLALVDYKTGTDKEADDVFAFQLAIYAAAGRGEGLNVQAAYLHDLREGDRAAVSVIDRVTKSATQRANGLIGSLVDAQFPAKPDKKKCTGCDVRAICQHALCGKKDL